MHKTIITVTSILAIASVGYAKAPDLGENFKLTTSERIESNITVGDLTGAPVIDKYGEQIATIQDLEIDPSNGEVSTAYLEVGGLLGIGSEYVSLPYSELSYDKAKARFNIKTTRSEIKAYIDSQERSMDAHNNANSRMNRDDMLDEDSSLAAMWQKVKTSLGVGDEELAEVEVEVRGDKLYLEGEVSDREMKKKIGEVFQSSTELKVINKIKVKK
jgi:sporulation protein YlmC with PRC-barrel domain